MRGLRKNGKECILLDGIAIDGFGRAYCVLLMPTREVLPNPS